MLDDASLGTTTMANEYLKKYNLPFRNFLRESTGQPMVFAWMPAISIYFDDPDGHSLEFIGILNGQARPDKGIISYDDWLTLNPMEE